MSDINHIVFDIGSVLLHYDPELPFRRLIPDEEKRRWFLDNVCTPEWNIEQDRGRAWKEAEDLLIAEHPDEADNIRAFRRHWHEMIPHHIEDSVAIMTMLIETGHDVTMLTNFASDTFLEASERFDFLNRPRGVTVSADVRLLKPDHAIYDHHTQTFGLEPAKTLFIDDSQKNVDGASDFGWQAVLFTDPYQLSADLAERGISTVS
ncbi:MAG: HAD family hydrolase [Rhizobiaceae bacterium]